MAALIFSSPSPYFFIFPFFFFCVLVFICLYVQYNVYLYIWVNTLNYYTMWRHFDKDFGLLHLFVTWSVVFLWVEQFYLEIFLFDNSEHYDLSYSFSYCHLEKKWGMRILSRLNVAVDCEKFGNLLSFLDDKCSNRPFLL